jgi:hypothetical protein
LHKSKFIAVVGGEGGKAARERDSLELFYPRKSYRLQAKVRRDSLEISAKQSGNLLICDGNFLIKSRLIQWSEFM